MSLGRLFVSVSSGRSLEGCSKTIYSFQPSQGPRFGKDLYHFDFRTSTLSINRNRILHPHRSFSNSLSLSHKKERYRERDSKEPIFQSLSPSSNNSQKQIAHLINTLKNSDDIKIQSKILAKLREKWNFMNGRELLQVARIISNTSPKLYTAIIPIANQLIKWHQKEENLQALEESRQRIREINKVKQTIKEEELYLNENDEDEISSQNRAERDWRKDIEILEALDDHNPNDTNNDNHSPSERFTFNEVRLLYTLCLDLFAQLGLRVLCSQMIPFMVSHGITIDPDHFSKLMKSFETGGDWESAIRLLELLVEGKTVTRYQFMITIQSLTEYQKFNLVPVLRQLYIRIFGESPVIDTIILNGLLENKSLEEASKFSREIYAARYQYDAKLFATLIRLNGLNGNLEECTRLLEVCRNLNMLNIVHINFFMMSCINTPSPSPDRALNIYHNLVDFSNHNLSIDDISVPANFRFDKSKPRSPNFYTFEVAATAYSLINPFPHDDFFLLFHKIKQFVSDIPSLPIPNYLLQLFISIAQSKAPLDKAMAFESLINDYKSQSQHVKFYSQFKSSDPNINHVSKNNNMLYLSSKEYILVESDGRFVIREQARVPEQKRGSVDVPTFSTYGADENYWCDRFNQILRATK